MARFVFTVNFGDGSTKKVHYDNSDSSLTWEDGTPIPVPEEWAGKKFKPLPGRVLDGRKAKYGIRKLRIVLGLKCNYACQYCLQTHPRTQSEAKISPEDVQPFVDGMDWVGGKDYDGEGLEIGLWGGEPFVYWRSLKPLGESLRRRFPKALLSMATNGSLINKEKVEWLDRLNFLVSISHDGPGQSVRGPDPFDNPETRKWILELHKRLYPKNRISFSAVLNNRNTSRRAIEEFFRNVLQSDAFGISEGNIIDVFGNDSAALSIEDHFAYRKMAFHEGIADDFEIVQRFLVFKYRVMNFMQSSALRRPYSSLGTRCDVESASRISVDIKGNVLTCNNVSGKDRDQFGNLHAIGNVSDFDAIRSHVHEGIHLFNRDECRNCPVAHMCRGGCSLPPPGPLFDQSCKNLYSDTVVALAISIFLLTNGGVLTYIDGEKLPEDRKDIFGLYQPELTDPPPPPPKKKIIPIHRGVSC
jgi:uncharacterized protein